MIPEIVYLITVVLIIVLFFILAQTWLDIAAMTGYFLTLHMMGAAVYLLLPGYPAQGLIDSIYLPAAMMDLTLLLWFFFGTALITLFLSRSATPAFAVGLPRLSLTANAVSVMLFASVVLVAMSVGLNAFLLVSKGGVGPVLQAYKGGNVHGLNLARPIVTTAAYMPAAVAGLLIVLRHQGRMNVSRRRLWFALSVSFLGILSIALTGDRDTVFAPILVLLVSYFVMVRGWGLVRFGLLGGLVILMVGPAAVLRSALHKDHMDLNVIADGWEKVAAVSANTVPLNASLSIVWMTDDWVVGEVGLRDYANGAVAIVPRLVWPDKPRSSSGQRFKEMIKGSPANSGWPVYPPVLALYNGGLGFVIVAGFLTGLGTAVMQQVYRDHMTNPLSLTLIVIVVIKVLGLGFRDQSIFNFLTFVLPILLVMLAANTSSQITAGAPRNRALVAS